MTIGKKDLTEILEEDGQAELECHFCGKKYIFDEADIKKMLENM